MSKQKEYYVIRITEKSTGNQTYVKKYGWRRGKLESIDNERYSFNMDVIVETVPNWKRGRIWKTKTGVEKAMVTVGIAYVLNRDEIVVEIINMTRLLKLEELKA